MDMTSSRFMGIRVALFFITLLNVFGLVSGHAQTTKMYWASIQSNDILRADTDGSNKELLVLGIDESSVAYDSSTSKVYWIHQKGKSIYRANVNGTGIEALVTTGLDDPEDIELDTVNGKLYWSDSDLDTIKRADLDGSNVETVLTGISVAQGFALDVANGHIYFTELFGSIIWRANLDGSNESIILSLDFDEEAQDIAIDATYIYWTVTNEDKIMRATLAGTGKADLATDIDRPFGIEVDTVNSKIYWSSEFFEVGRMNLDGSGDSIISFTGGSYFDLDVANSRLFIGQQFNSEISSVSFSGTESTIVQSPAGEPRGISVDVVGGKMYWADRARNVIRRANLDGSAKETIVSLSGITNPQGVQLDLANGHLYWLDSSIKKIERVDLSDMSREVIITGTENSENFALDIPNNRAYLADFINDRILSFNLDGSDKQTRYTGSNFIWAIDIDRENNQIYFTEGAVIKKADMNPASGALSNITTIVGSGLTRPIGIRYFPDEDRIYWVDDVVDKVQRANADGSNVETLVTGSEGAWGIDIAYDRDYDFDGTGDSTDNCPVTANADQADNDGDDDGDVCDADDDNDTVADGSDNCQFVANLDQTDTNTDGEGDSCDNDDDGDLVLDATDNCQFVVNANQLDLDSDGEGDACDSDDDGDAVADIVDNCSSVANADQKNNDGDADGDACDTDDDNDSVADGSDNCPLIANSSQANTDGDSAGDACDSDDDNDGLSDAQEQSLGSNTLLADTDGDGVSDGQEFTDGTGLTDASSFLFSLSTNFCAEWNGFLGLLNIAEFVNLSSETQEFTGTLFSIDGDAEGVGERTVAAGGQTDLLVHDMQGFTADSYGKVCAQMAGGAPGDLDGRMVHYRLLDGVMQFAFSMPFSNGRSSSVFVPFNTYQPSFDHLDAEHLVANFITVLSLDTENEQSGSMRYYAQDGSLLGTEARTLSPGGRVDFAAHQFGTSIVGLAEWRPTDSSARFQVRNIRYLYDNLALSPSFTSAFQVEGVPGSGRDLILPVDTRNASSIVEISNTRDETLSFTVSYYAADGTLVDTINDSLAARATRHFIVDGFIEGALGSVQISSQGEGRLIATVMQYGRTATGGIQYLYGVRGKEALGSVLRGTYNNFLRQGCRLLIVNSSENAQTVSVSMKRFDGTDVLLGETLDLPGKGVVESDICANDSGDTLGVVTLTPEVPSGVAATIVRVGDGDSYRFPTPVR